MRDINRERDVLMAKKLNDQMAIGCINNDWAEDFINSVYNRLDAGLSLSEKQRSKLEELFERY